MGVIKIMKFIKNFQAPHSTLMRKCAIGRVPIVVLKRTILKKLEKVKD